MAKNAIANAYVQIIPTTEGVKNNLSNVFDKDASKGGDNAGNSFGKQFLSTATKIVAGLGIAKLFSGAIEAGGNVEQSFGGLETMFKDNFDQIAKYANEAWRNVGVSANEYAEQVTSFSASLLQSLDNDTTKAVESANRAMVDMADNSAKFGTDISSIQSAYQGFAKQNYTMLDNLKLGYGGTKTEMERLLKDATKLSGVKYDINNLSDVYDAIHVIQEEMGVAGTTALEARETLSGSMQEITASWYNLMGALAGTTDALDLTEAVNGLVTGISDYAKNLIPVVVNIVETLPDALITIISDLVPLLMEQAPILINGFLNGINTNLPKLINAGVNMLAKLIVGFANNLPAVVEWVRKLGGTIVETLKGIDWVTLGKNVIDGVVKGLKNFGSAIKDMLLSLAKSAFNSVKNFFGIHSPSRLMANEIGKYIPLGMAVGIEANSDSVINAMDELGALTLDSAELSVIKPLDNAYMGAGTNVAMGGININVYGAEGQNVRELAEEVSDVLFNQINNRRVAFEW